MRPFPRGGGHGKCACTIQSKYNERNMKLRDKDTKKYLLTVFVATFVAYIIPAVVLYGAPDKPCGVGRADANPKLLLNDT